MINMSLFKKYGIEKDTMLNAALNYAEHGLAVFPLEAQGKKPITKHGLKDASTDPDKIREMFAAHPYSNIGMACGSQSGGIIVVDIDVDEEKDKNGNDSLKEWEHEHGALPDTAMTLTGRGGNHYLYRSTGDTRSRIACKEGIDIRADGGYIVLPPSIHPNGAQYAWEYELTDFGIVNANQSVIDLMNEGVEPGKEFKVPDKIEPGSRNDIIYKLACSMQARGNGDKAILAAAKAENLERCDPPLDEEEVEKTVSSALKKPKGTAPYKGESVDKKETKELTTYTYDEIAAMNLQPPEFLVDGIVPKGVCLLGAPPKSGKSWMALDLALQVSSGGIFLGHDCKKTGVLYFALEDSLYRLMERTKKLQQNEPVSSDLHYAIYADKIEPGKPDSGFYKQLEMELDKYPNIELVIIDTLQLVTPSKQRGDDAYASTYTLLNSIRPFWQDRGIGFMLVHHTRKKSINDVDPFETFLGSQALTGATDAMYIIQSIKDMDYSNFFGRGRDFEDISLAIQRDEETCRWTSIGTTGDMAAMRKRKEYEENPIVDKIRKMVAQANGVPYVFYAKDLREDIQKINVTAAGSSAQNFGHNLKLLKPNLLKNDGIILEQVTERSSKGARWRVTNFEPEDKNSDKL